MNETKPEFPEHEKLKALGCKNQGLGFWIENCGFVGDATLNKILNAIIYMDDGEPTDEPRPNRKELIDFINWFRGYKRKLKRQHSYFEHNISKILSAYYGIDPQKLDEEKRRMIERW